jgi:DNA-binding XRE family transcriptional regulator
MAAAPPVRGFSSPGPEPTQDPHATRRFLAKRLRLLRTQRGWSQETLAEHAGLHRAGMEHIEKYMRRLQWSCDSQPEISRYPHRDQCDMA